VASLDRETDDDKVGRWIIDFVAAGRVNEAADAAAGEVA
jgi:hypothetical protein